MLHSNPGSSRRVELLDGALDPIACAIGRHRVHRIVVRRPRRKAIHAHAKTVYGWFWFSRIGDFAVWLISLGFVPKCTTPKRSSEPPGLLLVHLMMADLSFANSSSGPCVIWTRADFGAGGRTLGL